MSDEPRQPFRVGPRGTFYFIVDRATRGRAYRWLARVLVASIGAALFSLLRYLGGF